MFFYHFPGEKSSRKVPLPHGPLSPCFPPQLFLLPKKYSIMDNFQFKYALSPDTALTIRKKLL
jgi:hypothetical protein